jgi:hypothetical protein
MTDFNVDLSTRRRWSEHHAWLADRLVAFWMVFSKFVPELQPKHFN